MLSIKTSRVISLLAASLYPYITSSQIFNEASAMWMGWKDLFMRVLS